MENFKNVAVVLLVAAVLPAMSRASSAENPMRVTTEENVVSIHNGKSALLRYRYWDVPFKPCVQELFSPDGINILRDSPADHKHHHALMFAVSADGVNFWEEQKEPGHQIHKAFTEVRVNYHNETPCGGFTEQIGWVDPKTTQLMLDESRTIEACQLSDLRTTILYWESNFSVPSGKDSVTLAGSHYFGLGMRFVESMDVAGQFRNAEGEMGEIVRGDERLVRAKWCAFTAVAGGKLVTVAMFGHPDNVRDPTQWFTMTKPFAYLSATLNLHREPLTIASDEPLRLRYAVALWDGRVENSLIDQTYRWWIAD
jgi:hypothetical protein